MMRYRKFSVASLHDGERPKIKTSGPIPVLQDEVRVMPILGFRFGISVFRDRFFGMFAPENRRRERPPIPVFHDRFLRPSIVCKSRFEHTCASNVCLPIAANVCCVRVLVGVND